MLDNTQLPPKDHNNPPFDLDDKFFTSHAAKAKAIAKRLNDPTQLKKASKKMRSDWFDYGLILAEARDNIPSNKLFNAWLKQHGLDELTHRNARSDAIWMVNLSDEMLELIPETLNDPKAIRTWYRKTLKEAVAASEADLGRAGKLDDYGAFVDALPADDWDIFAAKYRENLDKLPFSDLPAVEAAEKLLSKLAKHNRPGEVFAELTRMIQAGALDAPEDDLSPEDDPAPEDDDEPELEFPDDE